MIKYYLKLTNGKYEILDLSRNKKLEVTRTSEAAALSVALMDALNNYGQIKVIDGYEYACAPDECIHVFYKEGWIDLRHYKPNFKCKFQLHKLKKEESEPTLQPTQLSLFAS